MKTIVNGNALINETKRKYEKAVDGDFQKP